MENNWITVNGEELTVRGYLKLLKKEFKKKGVLDKRIEETHFDDTSLIYIEDETAKYGSSSWNYGINRGNIEVYRRH